MGTNCLLFFKKKQEKFTTVFKAQCIKKIYNGKNARSQEYNITRA